MNVKKNITSRHGLVCSCTGESTVDFIIYADGTAEVSYQDHPDVPAQVEVVTVEEARDAYRRAVKAGYFAY